MDIPFSPIAQATIIINGREVNERNVTLQDASIVVANFRSLIFRLFPQDARQDLKLYNLRHYNISFFDSSEDKRTEIIFKDALLQASLDAVRDSAQRGLALDQEYMDLEASELKLTQRLISGENVEYEANVAAKNRKVLDRRRLAHNTMSAQQDKIVYDVLQLDHNGAIHYGHNTVTNDASRPIDLLRPIEEILSRDDVDFEESSLGLKNATEFKKRIFKTLLDLEELAEELQARPRESEIMRAIAEAVLEPLLLAIMAKLEGAAAAKTAAPTSLFVSPLAPMDHATNPADNGKTRKPLPPLRAKGGERLTIAPLPPITTATATKIHAPVAAEAGPAITKPPLLPAIKEVDVIEGAAAAAKAPPITEEQVKALDKIAEAPFAFEDFIQVAEEEFETEVARPADLSDRDRAALARLREKATKPIADKPITAVAKKTSDDLTQKLWNFAQYIYALYSRERRASSNDLGYYNIINRGTARAGNQDDIIIMLKTSKESAGEYLTLHCTRPNSFKICKINQNKKTIVEIASLEKQPEKFDDFIDNVAAIKGLPEDQKNKVLEGKTKAEIKPMRPSTAKPEARAGAAAGRRPPTAAATKKPATPAEPRPKTAAARPKTGAVKNQPTTLADDKAKSK